MFAASILFENGCRGGLATDRGASEPDPSDEEGRQQGRVGEAFHQTKHIDTLRHMLSTHEGKAQDRRNKSCEQLKRNNVQKQKE